MASAGANGSLPVRLSQPAQEVDDDAPQRKKAPGPKQEVAAIVNGEAIPEKEVDAAMPDDMFEDALKSAREEKLECLISMVSMRQFLDKQNVAVSEEELDAEIARQRANPPSAGCPCCRYQSLEQYMQVNHITMAELRGISSNELRFQKYLDALWTRAYPTPDDVARLLDSRRPEITSQYMKAYHIFFNTMQDPRSAQEPEAVKKEKMELGKKAWQRLQEGETFAAVAKSMSEDAMSSQNGGDLGCVMRGVFGKDFDRVLFSLKAGATSEPVATQWGVHIIRRGEIGDDDILAIVKGDFKDSKASATAEQVDGEAKVERLGEWAGEGQ